MIITGSALFVVPGTQEKVLEKLREFPEVTFQAKSEAGSELVVTMEADDHGALEALCNFLKEQIPEIIDVTHIYVNFEEEVEKMISKTNERQEEC
jgi:nitrate reductase NapAB chaperone NapD